MENTNTNYSQSVTGVAIKDGKVLLARHTYGAGTGKLIVPGGYVEFGESPIDAVKREFLEETGVTVDVKELIAIRFNSHDWYAAFSVEYISGEARSDTDENDEVVWMEIDEALTRDDVPNLTKELIKCARKKDKGLIHHTDYAESGRNGTAFLYGIDTDIH